MGKQAVYSNPKAQAAQDELDHFLDFCRDFGYRFNEADLYNFRSYAFQQFNKHAQNKSVKNMWDEDARRFAGRF